MISKGKIEIAIPKTSFNPVDVVSGIATSTLKKPAKARKFTGVGEQKITEDLKGRKKTIQINIEEASGDRCEGVK